MISFKAEVDMKLAGWMLIVFGALVVGNAAWGFSNNFFDLQSAMNYINHHACTSEDAACAIAPNTPSRTREAIQTMFGFALLIPGLALADVKLRRRNSDGGEPITLFKSR
jgi:hypothetical protein